MNEIKLSLHEKHNLRKSVKLWAKSKKLRNFKRYLGFYKKHSQAINKLADTKTTNALLEKSFDITESAFERNHYIQEATLDIIKTHYYYDKTYATLTNFGLKEKEARDISTYMIWMNSYDDLYAHKNKIRSWINYNLDREYPNKSTKIKNYIARQQQEVLDDIRFHHLAIRTIFKMYSIDVVASKSRDLKVLRCMDQFGSSWGGLADTYQANYFNDVGKWFVRLFYVIPLPFDYSAALIHGEQVQTFAMQIREKQTTTSILSPPPNYYLAIQEPPVQKELKPSFDKVTSKSSDLNFSDKSPKTIKKIASSSNSKLYIRQFIPEFNQKKLYKIEMLNNGQFYSASKINSGTVTHCSVPKKIYKKFGANLKYAYITAGTKIKISLPQLKRQLIIDYK